MRKAVAAGALIVAAALTLFALLTTGSDEGAGPRRPIPPGAAPCTLSGRVLDSEGSPLAGVEVRARPVSRGPAFRAAALTDADGAFRVRLFPPRGLWQITAHPPGRSPFAGMTPLPAAPGASLQIVLREPARPAVADEPNVAGEVVDSYGRLLTGIPVVALIPNGAVLARAETGDGGAFAMRVEAEPPLTVRLESSEAGSTVTRLPRLDLVLFCEGLERPRGGMVVHVDLTTVVPTASAVISLHDSLGAEARRIERPLLDGPFRIERVPYGAYDVRVTAGDSVGAVQGFDFSLESTDVVVPVGQGVRVHGDLTRPARVHLISRSPTMVPLGREFREADGMRGVVRGVWAGSETADAFDLRGIPPGEYVLLISGKRVETFVRVLTLTAGEDRDLGLLEIEEAQGAVSVVVRDREGDLEYGYVVTLYSGTGLTMSREVGPGPDVTARFDPLPTGRYRYRVERLLDGRRHRRHVGWDRPVEVEKGGEKTVEADCTWRFE
jgi:hypothetical protein